MKKYILLLTLAILTFVTCKKETVQEHTTSSTESSITTSGPISIEQAKTVFGSSNGEVSDRDYEVSLTGVVPIWDAAVSSKYAGQTDILIVPVEPSKNRLPGGGANLIFFKTKAGGLDYNLLFYIPEPTYWQANNYRSTLQNFTGAMISMAPTGKMGEVLFFNGGTLVGTDDGDLVAYVAPEGCGDDPDCPSAAGGGSGNGFWSTIGGFFSAIGGFFSGQGGNGNGETSNEGGFVGAHGPNFGIPTTTSNPAGGGTNPLIISGYFDPSLFDGIERKNATMINQFKDQYCLSASSQALLGSIISGCGLSQDPEELFFELKETLFGGVANMPQCAKDVIVADRLNSINSGGPDDITAEELMSIFGEENVFSCDMVPGITEAEEEPLNPPITVGNPICAQIFPFVTITDDFTNEQYSAMILNNAYLQFAVRGDAPLLLHIDDIRLAVHASNNNNNCLASSSAFAANAINIIVLEKQQFLDGLDPGPLSDEIISNFKSDFLKSLNREFRIQAHNCNPAYTTEVSLSAAQNNWDTVPGVDCDVASANCP